MEAKVYKYRHYLHYASFVLDGDVAYLVVLKNIDVDYEDDTEVTEYPTIYDFVVRAVMPDRTVRVPESMRPRMHPSHCDVAFYDHALPAAAAMADPEDMFVRRLSGGSKAATYHIYPRPQNTADATTVLSGTP